MKNAVKILHLLGFVMFLGGILGTIITTIVVGSDTDPVLIDHQRQIVSAIVQGLTVPGMWIVILSGLYMAFLRKYNLLKIRWLTLKSILGTLIFINGSFILVPLADKVTALASQSASQGALAMNYLSLKGNEDMFGAVNLILILIVTVIAVFKPMARKTA